MNANARRVGRVTVAVGFVATGSALLLDNVLGTGPRFTTLLLRLWPVLLIGFGLEFLIAGLLNQAGEALPMRFEVGGALLLAGALALASVVRAFTGFGFTESPPPPVTNSQTVTRSVPVGQARRVLVEVDVGRVILTAHEAEEVRVEAEYGFLGVVPPHWSGLEEEFSLTVVEGHTVRITARAPKDASPIAIGAGTLQAVYRIYAPEGLTVKVVSNVGAIHVEHYDGDLDLNANAGGITVEDSAGSLKALANSGGVQIARFTGDVTVSTNAGPVKARGVNGELTIRSGTAVINVEDHVGPGLTAETRTGSIHARLENPPEGPVTLRTGTGSINLSLPEASDATISATTRSGSISGLGAGDGSGPSRSATRTLGAGTHLVRLEANTGSIRVDTR